MNTPLESCSSQIAAALDRRTRALVAARAKYDARTAPAADIRDKANRESDKTYADASQPIKGQFERAIAAAREVYLKAHSGAGISSGRKGAATRAFNSAILPAQVEHDDAMAPIEAARWKARRDADSLFERATRSYSDELSSANAIAERELSDSISAACDTASALTGKTVRYCATCRGVYDSDDASYHEVAIDCGCSRCRGKPRCYMCGSSFCFCGAH